MVYVDTREFKKKCDDITEESKTGQLLSPAWVWMSCGAMIGLLASCIKRHTQTVEPIIGRYTSTKKGK